MGIPQASYMDVGQPIIEPDQTKDCIARSARCDGVTDSQPSTGRFRSPLFSRGRRGSSKA